MFQISSLTFSCFAFLQDSVSLRPSIRFQGSQGVSLFFDLNHTYLELWLAGHRSPLGAVFRPHTPLCQAGPAAEPGSASGPLQAGPVAAATSAGPLWAEGSASASEAPELPTSCRCQTPVLT